LPAVQKVRESASRVSCQNNLRQIGMALHMYHDVNRRLPPGYAASVPYSDGVTDTAPGWGWAAYILPYLDQGNLAGQFDFSKPVQSFPGIQTMIPVYLCPSDICPDRAFPVCDAFGNPITLAAPSSYAASCGGDESDTADPTGFGVFYRNSRTKLTDITDGTSQTVLVAERACANARGVWAGAISGGVCARGPFNGNPGTSQGAAPVLVLAHCHLINTEGDTDGGLDDFSSRHWGGANFLFADGSVHFLRNVPSDRPDGSYTRESLILQALGTRSRGEVVPGDWVE
jgi:prepilin-type processing-associated H-X9-DG protein